MLEIHLERNCGYVSKSITRPKYADLDNLIALCHILRVSLSHLYHSLQLDCEYIKGRFGLEDLPEIMEQCPLSDTYFGYNLFSQELDRQPMNIGVYWWPIENV
jgi:hypothetical protein